MFGLFSGNNFESKTAKPEKGFRWGKDFWNHRYNRAKLDVNEAATRLTNAHEMMKGYNAAGIQAPEAMRGEFDAAARNFNRASSHLGYAEKKLIPSIRNLAYGMLDKVGVETSKLYSSKIRMVDGEVASALAKSASIRGNFFERVLSKPIRVLGHFPIIAWALGIGGGIAAISSASHRHAEQRTQENMMLDTQAQLAAQQQQAPLATATAQAPTYQITAEEYAALQAKLKGGDQAPQTGHADAVSAARQQPQADGTPIAAL